MAYQFASYSLFVDPTNGDDANSGATEALAKATLASAVSAATAKQTIFLSAGTHTVAPNTSIDLPDGVNLIGAGREATKISGSISGPGPTGDLLRVAGKNHIADMQLVTESGACLLQVGGGAASATTAKNVWFGGVASAAQLIKCAAPSGSARQNLNVVDCLLDIGYAAGFDVQSNADIVSRRNTFSPFTTPGGSSNAFTCASVDYSIMLASTDDIFQYINSPSFLRVFNFQATGALNIKAVIARPTFFMGSLGNAIYTSESSTGAVTVEDVGGGNLLEQAMDLTNGGTLVKIMPSEITAAEVRTSRTWYASDEGQEAANIVTVAQNFAGTFAILTALNPGGDIATVDSVAITGAATPTATNLAKSGNGRAAHFDVPALTTTGTYTVIVTVTTVDGQTIPTKCTLKVE